MRFILYLMNTNVKDWDFCTTASKLLKKIKIKIIKFWKD